MINYKVIVRNREVNIFDSGLHIYNRYKGNRYNGEKKVKTNCNN